MNGNELMERGWNRWFAQRWFRMDNSKMKKKRRRRKHWIPDDFWRYKFFSPAGDASGKRKMKEVRGWLEWAKRNVIIRLSTSLALPSSLTSKIYGILFNDPVKPRDFFFVAQKKKNKNIYRSLIACAYTKKKKLINAFFV